MPEPAIYRFTQGDRRYAIDPDTCFCFECDAISWDVLEYYPGVTANRVLHLLGDRHDRRELSEVMSELEWLRATKAILKTPSREELMKRFEIERGLRRVAVAVDGRSPAGHVPEALRLLLSRAGAQQQLEFEVRFAPEDAARLPVAAWCAEAFRAARLAGRKLTLALRMGPLPPPRKMDALAGHALAARLDLTPDADAAAAITAWLRAGFDRPDRLASACEGLEGASVRVILRPGNGVFADAVQALADAGFGRIELDLDGAWTARPGGLPASLFDELRQAAVYYANQLVQGRYFRLDPIADLFYRIYQGEPVRRADFAGVNELAVGPDGAVYPSMLWVGDPHHRVGDLAAGALDEDTLRRFDDIGPVTTPACMRCWARGLCGGGTAAVHEALGGDMRAPLEAWCVAQRGWLESAVAAFNLLAGRGVNFTRIYQNLGRLKKPSFFQLARAAFRMNIGLRPIEESDAEWLTQWENWNDAAYFLCGERGLFMATRYDREMDSLHPREYEQEFVLLRKTGAPLGLLRVRPEKVPGTARAWVYLREAADYADAGVRRSFRNLLGEAAGQKELRRITVPAGPREDGLAAFLESVGFKPDGIEREALYLHGGYHDVRLFSLALG